MTSIVYTFSITLSFRMVVEKVLKLGEKIKRLRESRDWSQAELARRAGVTKSAISTYELGMRTPSADVVCAFAKAFGVSADYLLGIAERRAVEIEGLSERDEALVRELISSLKEK